MLHIAVDNLLAKVFAAAVSVIFPCFTICKTLLLNNSFYRIGNLSAISSFDSIIPWVTLPEIFYATLIGQKYMACFRAVKIVEKYVGKIPAVAYAPKATGAHKVYLWQLLKNDRLKFVPYFPRPFDIDGMFALVVQIIDSGFPLCGRRYLVGMPHMKIPRRRPDIAALAWKNICPRKRYYCGIPVEG